MSNSAEPEPGPAADQAVSAAGGHPPQRSPWAGRRVPRRANPLVLQVPPAVFSPLVDVDPRLADALVTSLTGLGVAAYVLPRPGTVGGYLEVRLSTTPQDRVWVDGRRLADARRLVDAELPHLSAEIAGEPGAPHSAIPPVAIPPVAGPPVAGPRASEPRASEEEPAAAGAPAADPAPAPDRPSGLARRRAPEDDDDDAFATIIAGFYDAPEPPAGGVAPWPVAEDAPAGRAGASDSAPRQDQHRVEEHRRRAAADRLRRLGEEHDREQAEALAAAAERTGEGHYEPPPATPLPPPHPVTRWAWVGILTGVGVLLVPVLVGGSAPYPLAVLSVVAVVGGIATLIWRMRDAPGDGDGPDDGAVV